MASKRRKRHNPQPLRGGDPEREFSFFTPSVEITRDVGPQQSSEVPLYSPPKRIKLAPPEVPKKSVLAEVTNSLDLDSPPEQPSRTIPMFVYPAVTKFSGIPIGRISITLTETDLDRFLKFVHCCDPIKFYLVWTLSEKHLVKIESRQDVFFLPARIDPALDDSTTVEALFGLAGRTKHAKLFLSPVAGGTFQFGVDIWVAESLCEFHNPSELPRKSKVVEHCKNLVHGLYPEILIQVQEAETSKEFPAGEVLQQPSVNVTAKIHQFYQDVQQRRREEFGEDDITSDIRNIPGLTAGLWEYQRKAVTWMLRRERGEEEEEGQRPLHMFWTELPTSLEQPVYYNSQTGRFSNKRFDSCGWPKGGILADEMGLGKTVEVLALIMAHKWLGRMRDGASSRENRTPLSSPLDLSSLGLVANQDIDIELSSPLNLGSVTNQDVDVELTSDIELSSPLNLGSERSVTNQDVDVELSSPLNLDSERSVTNQDVDVELSSPLNLDSERSVTIHDIDTSDIELSSPLTYMYGEVNSSASPLSSSLDLSSPLCVDDVQGDGVSEDILPMETGLNSPRDVKEQQQESSSAKTANEEAATQPITLTYTTSELQTSTLQGTPLGDQMDCFKGRPNEATSVGVDNGPASDNLVSVAPPQTIMTATLATQTIFPQASIVATPPRTRKAIPSSLLIEDVVYREDSVRCLCGATREGICEEEFVQCERCLVWQHSSCAGYDGSKQDTFVCVKCLLDKPLPSGTTLIISPQSIVHQWMEEIAKHTQDGALKVLHYSGVKEVYVSPFELASYDIVLVTYETLKTEVYHATSHEMSRVLRHRKRYSCSPSPLPAVLWWRMCLDEAQMVESTNAKAAEMTQKLSGVNRWCITGTPVQKDLLDLYGLTLFLEVDPYSQFGWFKQLVWHPFLRGSERPMLSLFSRVMWRNSKADVADELQLPNQSKELHWLWFSAVEAYFYKKQRDTCAADATKAVAHIPEANITLSSLLQATFHKLMAPLHRLRQACCHPQIVRGGYLPISNRNCLTMSALLPKLTAQAKQEAREALRQLVAALNGLASIYIIKEEWSSAVDSYREAMQSWQEHEEHLDCDKLQRIHTMENLYELWSMGHLGDSHTLRDDQLKDEALILRRKYLEKPEGVVRAAVESLMSCRSTTEDTKDEANWTQAEYLDELPPGLELPESSPQSGPGQENSPLSWDSPTSGQEGSGIQDQPVNLCPENQDISGCEGSPVGQSTATAPQKPKRKPVSPSKLWWMSIIEWSLDRSLTHELMDTVNTEISANPDLPAAAHCFRDPVGLQYLLCSHMDKIESKRQSVLEALDELAAPPSDSLVSEVAACHLPKKNLDANPCTLCQAEKSSIEYGQLLFMEYQDTREGRGSRVISIFERILRSLLTFARRKRGPKKLLKSSQAFLSYLEALKKEYDAVRSLWMAEDRRLCVHDEVRVASTRLRLMDPLEALLFMDAPFAVHPYEVDFKLSQFASDKTTARSDLAKCLGQVLYLNNLAKSQDQQHSRNEESCPVCTAKLGGEWGVFTCGHPLCMECMFTMVTLRRQHMPWGRREEEMPIKCPLCRLPSLVTQIHYVSCNGDGEDTPIKGSHSTKIIGVTRLLKNIEMGDPGAKSLVFSSWLEVLDLIALALRDNSIKYSFLKTKKTFQDNLSEFKLSPDVNVLLLPIQSGSKGLNIVEATHVILVEPSLNIGAELQAIGRVHRMGQTKPTTVHRFYVRSTVEERIYKLLTGQTDNTKFLISNERESVLTIAELKQLIQD